VATIEKRERKTVTVYQADVRIRGFPRQKRPVSISPRPRSGTSRLKLPVPRRAY